MADASNPIPGIPPQLLAMMANVPSKKAAGQNALTQGFFGQAPQGQGSGLQGALPMFMNSMTQKNNQNQIAKLLQQLRGGAGQQPQMPQGQPQAQAPMPNPMAQAMGGGNNDPLGLFGGQ